MSSELAIIFNKKSVKPKIVKNTIKKRKTTSFHYLFEKYNTV